MTQERVQRRLAAILAADVVGYSRLIEHDEAGTVAALKAWREASLEPLLAEHEGRIVKTMGDGVLVAFASAVNAVACAVALQQGLAAAGQDVPENRRLVLRIGVSLGDLIIDGDDLFGDGVIIATRLESLAEPGGILISGSVSEQVQNKLQIGLEDLGPRDLKNMSKPIRVLRVTAAEALPDSRATPRAPRSKPSIAVLPFTNLGGEIEQQYFSDGVTEDIITELSRYRSLLVIARNSSFQFRGPTVDLGAVRQRLGVKYIVEGSVRRSADRLRVTAQLIDADAENHIWAERYDRNMQDIFAVQDEIARTIATTLEGRVVASGAVHIKRKQTEDLMAYDYFLKGRECDANYDYPATSKFYARAVELDPDYAQAYAGLAISLAVEYWLEQKPEILVRAEQAAQKAVALDDHDSWSQDAIGYVYLQQRRFDVAGIHLERAIALNPNDVQAAGDHANWLTRTGRPAEALERLDAIDRRDPFRASWIWDIRHNALFHLKRYDEAVTALQSMPRLMHWHHAFLAATFAHAGRWAEAREALTAFMAARPDGSIAVVAAAEPYAAPALLEHLVDGLRKAGLKG